MIHLNEQEISKSLFLRKDSILGSPNKIFGIIVSMNCFYGIILAVINGLELQWTGLIVDTLLYLIELILIGVIWSKVPSYTLSKDTTGVHKETQYILRIGIIILSIYIIDTILKSIFGPDYIIYSQLIANTFIKIGLISCGLMTSCYVLYVQKVHDRLLTNTKQRISISLNEIFNTPQYIDIFFEHLSNELSPELLLAYVEFNQFKIFMRNDSELLNHLEQSGLNKTINLSRNIPQSSILSNNNSYGVILRKLYNKYIKHGARFQINVPYNIYETMSFITDKYAHNKQLSIQDKESIYLVYDEAIDCLITFMGHSLDWLLTYSSRNDITKFEDCIKQV